MVPAAHPAWLPESIWQALFGSYSLAEAAPPEIANAAALLADFRVAAIALHMRNITVALQHGVFVCGNVA